MLRYQSNDQGLGLGTDGGYFIRPKMGKKCGDVLARRERPKNLPSLGRSSRGGELEGNLPIQVGQELLADRLGN